MTQPETIAHYRVSSKLGEGGMGAVYRAIDTKLDREVAIKILPDALAQDPERLARFEREAKVLASLNHPHIAAIYGVEDRALVMELVPGETLRGPLPLATALNYARQIASALHAAHEKGIVHRDLKPANIVVTPEGVVKVLDFGLAAVTQPSASDGRPLDSPTLTISATHAGMIMGTAAYMSPEQASGKPVDKRADIWSFGVVLWEMLTGNRMFDGETISHTLAAVLTAQPDLGQVPLEVRRLLRGCLEKDPKRRLKDIGDLEFLLEPEPAPAVRGPARASSKVGWIAAVAVLSLLAASLAFLQFREKPPDRAVARFVIQPPEGASVVRSVISPDGRRLVFAAQSPGKTQLFVRPMDATAAVPLAGTEGASSFCWSPDSAWIAYFTEGKLRKILAAGGPSQVLASFAGAANGSTWSSSGVILMAGGSHTPLFQLPASGGTPVAVTNVDTAGTSLRFPWFLPDGNHFLFAVVPDASAPIYGDSAVAIAIGSLDSRDSRVLLHADSNAIFAQGHLLFLRDGTLLAQRFDPAHLTLTGDAVPVAERVFAAASGWGGFSASAGGVLVYQSSSDAQPQLAWIDRAGKRLGFLGEPAQFFRMHLSPDGKNVAVGITDATAHNLDLWIYDVARAVRTRFTFEPSPEPEGLWSPDGATIVFNSSRKGILDLYRKASNGSGSEELLFADNRAKHPNDWSPDGRFLLFTTMDTNSGYDVWVLPDPLGKPGESKPYPFLHSEFHEQLARFSPDGKWVVYQSSESGRDEIYATPFPGPGGKRQISVNGGTQPHWRRDGRELFYLGPGGSMMAAEIRLGPGTLDVGEVRTLFSGLKLDGSAVQYDVSADGQRFLAIVPSERSGSSPLTLVQNWTAELKAGK